MGSGNATTHDGQLLGRSGARRDMEDARRVVELPPPVLGRRSQDRGLAVTWRMRDGRWNCHRPCCVVACEIGVRCDVEDARRAVKLPPPMMGHCSRDRGLAVTWRTRDGRWSYHRLCWVAAREIRGWPWCGERKMGGGAATACARSLLAKSGPPRM